METGSFPLPTVEQIREVFAVRQPAIFPLEKRRHAAVAMLFRQGSEGAEILFIERATRDGDPWSGDLGFPGGKVEPEDGDPRRAAERETLEEIGLDLSDALFLGRLDDLVGDRLPVQVSCFLFLVNDPLPFTFGDEVVQAFWISLGTLLDPARRVKTSVFFQGSHLTHPAIDLLGPGRTVLWGITYRLVSQFLSIMRGRTG